MSYRPAESIVDKYYRDNRTGLTAYVDETYNVDPHHGRQFYVMVAVVIESSARDEIRTQIRAIADSNYWHTTVEIRTNNGLARTQEMLDYLGHPDGHEVCVVSHEEPIALGDSDGEDARARCFTRLLAYLATGKCPSGPVLSLVLERRREQSQVNRDAHTRKQAVANNIVPQGVRLLQVSPRDEPLLWLPDLVCSAYRQKLVRGDPRLFATVAPITIIIGPE